MISVDTNVVVRVITNDDPARAKRAARTLGAPAIWLSKTVLLETEWVLRYTYEFAAADINRALVAIVSLRNATIEDVAAVRTALTWHASGLDFADALHMASGGAATRFVTFDEKLARRAGKIAGVPRVEMP